VLAATPDSLASDAYVFPTRTGRRIGESNFSNHILRPAVKRASENWPRPRFHHYPNRSRRAFLRRTFCSLLYALNEPGPVIMDELGHADDGITLRIYAQVMRRAENERQAFRDLVEGGVLAAQARITDARTKTKQAIGAEGP
jgi:integrase